MADPNLAVLIFLIVLLTQVVAWVGKSVLQGAAGAAYSRVFLGGIEKEQRRLRKQVLEDKAELGRTSSQDEFAKWAKLRRKVDKGLAELEKSNAKLAAARSTFTSRFSTLIWLSTTGAQFALMWWYRAQPVFWLPDGWVPGPVGWLLRFPSAPRGSVSAGAWSTVCKRVLVTGEELVKGYLAPAEVAPEPVAVPVASQPAPSAKIEEIEHEKLD
ncbi:GET complex subunit get1 [Vanrija albida]|uniref:GET complex subunit get1 n=1 Tax=Vanrija albida TaxID=181172 RepID=A0ABR3PTK2_9TREE